LPLDFYVSAPGAIAYTPALEIVAERRSTNGWGLGDYAGYEVLIAPADCSLLGRSGWLIANDDVYSAIVVDCSQQEHKQAMIDNGLLADVSMKSLSHKQGWIVLK